MSDDKTPNRLIDTIASAVTVENIRNYILGVKKSGHPRALYDIVKDYTKPKKKKNKKGKGKGNSYSLYLKSKKGKKRKKDKHWKF